MTATIARAGQRGMRVAALLALVVTAIIASGGGQAEAANHPAVGAAPQGNHGNWSEKYTLTWNWASRDIPTRCVKIVFSGNITYSLNISAIHGVSIFEWTDEKLNDPRIDIYVTREGARSSCSRTSANLDGANLRQDWTGWGCDFNPSLGFSYPWGVTLSGWPSCGERRQLGRHTTETGVHSHYYQGNSGAPGGFGDYTSVGIAIAPCYGAYPTVTIHLNGGSDTFGSGSGPARRVCLPWH